MTDTPPATPMPEPGALLDQLAADVHRLAPMPPIVSPLTNTRLDSLVAQYEAARAEHEETKARFDELTDGIKAELAKAAPGHEKVFLHSAHLSTPLKLELRQRWTVDAKRLKRDDPVTYVTYAKQSASWYLVRV